MPPGEKDKKKDEKQRAEALTGQPKPPEAKTTLGSPDVQAHALARAQVGQLRTDVDTNQAAKIAEQKQILSERQDELKKKTAAIPKIKENWVAEDNQNTQTGDIATKVEGALTKPEVKEILEKSGIQDEKNDTNRRILSDVLTLILTERLHKIKIDKVAGGLGLITGNNNEEKRVTGILEDYAKKALEKFQKLFGDLNNLQGPYQQQLKSPIDLLQSFSDFTGTNFIKDKYFQAIALRDFLLLEKSNYEAFVDNFRKYLELGKQEFQLAHIAGPPTLQKPDAPSPESPKFDPQNPEAPKPEPARVDPPKPDASKVEPPKADEPKVESPKPDAPKAEAGKGEKQDVNVEESSTKDTDDNVKDEAAKKAALEKVDKLKVSSEAAEKASQEPFSFAKMVNDFIKLILSFFGKKIGPDGVDGILQAWNKEIPIEKRNELIAMYKECQKYFRRMGNIDVLFKSPEDVLKVVTDKKNSDLKTWSEYFERRLSKSEQDQIFTSQTITAGAVAGMFISKKETGDLPAELIFHETPQQKPNPTGRPKPIDRVENGEQAIDRIEDPAGTKRILYNYITKKGAPETAASFQNAIATGGKISLRGYIEGLFVDFLEKNPKLVDIFHDKLNTYANRTMIWNQIYKNIYDFTISEARTSEERLKDEKTLLALKKTMDEIIKQEPQMATRDPDVTYRTTPFPKDEEQQLQKDLYGADSVLVDSLRGRDPDAVLRQPSSSPREAVYLLQTPEEAQALTAKVNAFKQNPEWIKRLIEMIIETPMEFLRIFEICDDPQSSIDPEIRRFTKKNQEFFKKAAEKGMELVRKMTGNNFIKFTNDFLKDVSQRSDWKAYFDQQWDTSKDFLIKSFAYILSSKVFPAEVSTPLEKEISKYIEEKVKQNSEKILEAAGEMTGLSEELSQLKNEFPGIETAFKKPPPKS